MPCIGPCLRTFSRFVVALGAFGLSLSSCGDGGGTGPLQATSQLSFTTQPLDAVAGETLSPVVVTVSGETAPPSVSLALANGDNLGGTTSVAVVGGVARFEDLSIRTARTGLMLSASAAGAGSATSAAFDVEAGPLASLVIQDADTLVVAGETVNLIVEGQDEFGNPVSGEDVLLRRFDRQGGPLNTIEKTLAAGRVEFSYRATTTGRATVTAFGGGIASNSRGQATYIPFKQIDVGDDHACAIAEAHASGDDPLSIEDLPSGALYCWGDGRELAFGGLRSQFPVLAWSTTGGSPREPLVQVAAGASFTCVRSVSGDVVCFGANTRGQMGTGSTTPPQVSLAVIPAGVAFSDLSASAFHACGITEDRFVGVNSQSVCWGDNNFNQISAGATPALPGPPHFREWTALSPGTSHTCGATAGEYYCWGLDINGSLGHGGPSPVSNSGPARVVGSDDFVEVSAGSSVSCALDDEGRVYCWGFNGRGSVGVFSGGSPVLAPRRVSIPGDPVVTDVSIFNRHACALTEGGEVFCWGENRHGQLGDGTQVDRNRALRVELPGPVKQIATGTFSTCALLENGRAYCWGALHRYSVFRPAWIRDF